MPLPTLTPEQREQALAKAKWVRFQRAGIKADLKAGATTLPTVLAESAQDDAIAKMKVTALLEALPGVGKIRAAQIMERLGIDAKRRVRGLGANQRAALEQEFAAA